MVLVEVIFWFSVIVVLYTYLGYPLMLLGYHLVCRRNASSPDDAFSPTVSVVLAAYNEAACMHQKIENCLGLDYPRERLQILVGSDGSDDGTNDIVQEYYGQGVDLLAFHPRRGKMATVNRIVQKATGEVCVFSDISELFEPDALRRLVRHFADPEIGLVTGNHIYNKKDTGLGTGTSFYWRFKRFLQGVESRVYSGCTCDGTIYACRRELFPFPPENTINDDVAVPWGILSQGKRIVFEAGAIVRGDVLPETSRFFRQKVRSQAGKYQNFAQFPSLFRPWPIRRWWILMSHGVFPTLVPWFLVLALLSNGVLWFSGESPYRFLLIVQVCFYVLAAAGYIAEGLRIRMRLAAIPFYFVMANIGSLCGFFAYVCRIQQVAWQKVE